MAIGTPVLLKEQNNTGLTGQSSISLALATGAAAGDLVVVVGGFGVASTPTLTCADNSGGGNVYQLDVRADKTTSDTPHAYIFSCLLAGALTTSHTITVSSSPNFNRPFAAAFSISGIATSSWLDQFNSAIDAGAGTSPSSGNITTTQAEEILIGATTNGNTPQTLTMGSGWTRLGNHISGAKSGDFGYSIKAATGTYVFDGTFGGNAEWASCIASYKAPAAAGANPFPYVAGGYYPTQG